MDGSVAPENGHAIDSVEPPVPFPASRIGQGLKTQCAPEIPAGEGARQSAFIAATGSGIEKAKRFQGCFPDRKSAKAAALRAKVKPEMIQGFLGLKKGRL